MTTELQDFLDRYGTRLQALLSRLGEESPLARDLKRAEPALMLARALAEKADLPDHPLQIAVLGPTQAGKSTLVNLLLHQEIAGVSPLAGYTVHPQAFLHKVEEAAFSWVEAYYAGYRRCRVSELPREDYRCFAVASAIPQPRLPEMVLWDTPDFDSLKARHYLPGVLRTAALADVLIVVVSKDKYADRAVWEMLDLLEPLAQPILVCLNKVTAAGRETLLRSWKEKWRDHRRDPVPAVVPLPYWQDATERERAAAALQEALIPMLKQGLPYRKRIPHQLLTLVRHHWDRWRKPVEAELAAKARWQSLVENSLEQALAIYRHDFLEHPIAYETFQRALAELLILLEIPGLARPMTMFRRAVTWPLRKLFGKRRSNEEEPGELVILNRAVEHALLQLRQALMEQRRDSSLQHWWQALAQQYRDLEPDLLQRFQDDARHYYQAFQPQVEQAAEELYRHLKEMPVTLNSLRAARASADAAGLALLLQTGGIGPHDFVLAPAVLSLTSWLSETALGKYMERVAARLKRRQLEQVKELLERRLQTMLQSLPQRLDAELQFGFDAEIIQAVESQLKERRYGLQLF